MSTYIYIHIYIYIYICKYNYIDLYEFAVVFRSWLIYHGVIDFKLCCTIFVQNWKKLPQPISKRTTRATIIVHILYIYIYLYI